MLLFKQYPDAFDVPGSATKLRKMKQVSFLLCLYKTQISHKKVNNSVNYC